MSSPPPPTFSYFLEHELYLLNKTLTTTTFQERVVEEIKTVVGDTPRKIEYSDLGRLKYMEMCIKEAMRLYAVAPFIFRKTTEDFQFGKWVIPPDCTLAICIFNLHRDPNHWERPEEFYPEHFSSEAVLNRHPYAYVPFSAGPRRCIGRKTTERKRGILCNKKFFSSTIFVCKHENHHRDSLTALCSGK